MAFRKFKDIEYPVPGVDTAIQVLRPGAQYDMISRGGIIWNCLLYTSDAADE